MIKKFQSFGTLTLSFFLLSAVVRAQSYTANLSPAQEVPANGSTATGQARIVVNESALTIAYSITFTNLSSAQILGHIHGPAAIGANTGVQITFPVVGGTSGTISGSIAINAAQIAQIRAGLAYVNIHSTNFSGGEIRGQLAANRPLDFDGDGRTDPSVSRIQSGCVPFPNPCLSTFYNLRSSLGFQAINWGLSNDFVAPGDYDGDGRDDFAVYRPDIQSYFFILRSSNATFQGIPFGIAGDQPVARDYDGDGKHDPAVFRRGSTPGAQAYWYILQSTNGQLRSVPWGTTGGIADGNLDEPVPGDYDGDGKVDIAVYRKGNLVPSNSFLILRSSDNVYVPRMWGANGDTIVTGDYDGDGKTDFAVTRSDVPIGSPIIWFILQSSSGTFIAVQWGIYNGIANGDLPAQGDYDGDGRTDIAVVRYGSGPGVSNVFYFRRSLNNSLASIPWGSIGDSVNNAFDLH